MDINAYLEEIEKIDSKIANKTYESDMWKEIAKGSTGATDGERVQSSSDQQKMANAVAKYTDLDRQIEELKAKKDRFVERIEMLKKNHYEVMHDIYIKGLEPKQIAMIRKQNYSTVTSQHRRAKKELEKVIGEEDV